MYPLSRVCTNETLSRQLTDFAERNNAKVHSLIALQIESPRPSRAHRLPLPLLKTKSACGLLWNAILSLWLSPQDFRPVNTVCPDKSGTDGVLLMESHARVYAKACEVNNCCVLPTYYPHYYVDSEGTYTQPALDLR